jgi:transcriptional regulator with XRE-family HTH domain
MNDQNSALDMYVGARIRERRIKLNWTLSDLAEKLAVSHQQIQKYEQGTTRVSAGVMYKLSKIFSISPNFFFDGFYESKEEDLFYSPHETIPSKRTKALDIMIVEHDANDELLLRKSIEKTDIYTNILAFHDGEKALNFLKDKVNLIKFPRPELILLELNAPKIDGYFLLKEVKRDRNLCDIPVVIITNSISRQQMIDCYKHSAAGFMRKTQDEFSYEDAIKIIITYWGNVMSLPNMDHKTKEQELVNKR